MQIKDVRCRLADRVPQGAITTSTKVEVVDQRTLVGTCR